MNRRGFLNKAFATIGAVIAGETVFGLSQTLALPLTYAKPTPVGPTLRDLHWIVDFDIASLANDAVGKAEDSAEVQELIKYVDAAKSLGRTLTFFYGRVYGPSTGGKSIVDVIHWNVDNGLFAGIADVSKGICSPEEKARARSGRVYLGDWTKSDARRTWAVIEWGEIEARE